MASNDYRMSSSQFEAPSPLLPLYKDVWNSKSLASKVKQDDSKKMTAKNGTVTDKNGISISQDIQNQENRETHKKNVSSFLDQEQQKIAASQNDASNQTLAQELNSDSSRISGELRAFIQESTNTLFGGKNFDL